MKKLCALIALILLTFCLLCGAAFSEEASAVVGEKTAGLPVEPFTWEYLATIAGATLATMLIVQLLKLPMDKIWKIPTRIIVYVIALLVMTVATHFTMGLTWERFGLAAVNSVIVALTAMGGYEVTIAKLEKKDKTTDN